MPRTQRHGTEAELAAQDFLQQQGLQALARNHRCRGGEIDLVMRDRDTLVFVEVRLRRNPNFGGALASVDQRKQRRLGLAAQHYLQRHRWDGPCRFDVIGLDARGQCQWVKNAFEVS
jgi:putative endonuclease